MTRRVEQSDWELAKRRIANGWHDVGIIASLRRSGVAKIEAVLLVRALRQGGLPPMHLASRQRSNARQRVGSPRRHHHRHGHHGLAHKALKASKLASTWAVGTLVIGILFSSFGYVAYCAWEEAVANHNRLPLFYVERVSRWQHDLPVSCYDDLKTVSP